MKKFSSRLRDMLTEFIVNEIGSKGIDGITYVMKIRGKNDNDIQKYIDIRKEADRCGYDSDEVFRVFEVTNGFIFDMDISTMTHILVTIAQASVSITSKYGERVNTIYTEPVDVRKKELVRLAKKVIDNVDKGKMAVALFFRSSTGNDISITTKMDGEAKIASVDAFRMRMYDVATVNSKILVGTGVAITNVYPQYIIGRGSAVMTELVLKRE